MKKLITSLCLIVLVTICSRAQNVNVNPGAGSYATMEAAFAAINAGTHTGSITVTIVGNTTETGSAVLNASGVGGASYTAISIQPSGGGARTVSGAITGHLVDLNGANNVTIDGLNSGGNSLTFSNTATGASSTFRFIADASNNIIQNCTIQGSASTASNGVIMFSTGTVTGNDGNNINNCNITGAGTNLPVNGVFSLGTSAAIDNSGNTLNANNISDYFNAALLTSGISIGTGNSSWTITNNKLFQTATRTFTSAFIHNGILVGSGDGNTITGNTIGYASSSATGVYTMAGTIATRFIAFNLAVGTTTVTSVQGNIVTAISLATSSGAATTNGILCGINITAGNVNVGNVTANTIGASTGTGALVAIPTTTQGAIVGIHSSSTGTILIQNNMIGSFSSSGTTAAVAGSVFGINVSGAAASITISNNTIGNSTPNNMMAGTLGLTTGSTLASGINVSTTPVSLSVTNNTIQHFTSYGTGTGGYVRGINGSTSVNTTASNTVSQNTISNLTSNSALVGYTSGNTSAYGIQFSGGLNGTCSYNTISNIANINATATTNVVVSGINLASGLNSSAFGNRIWGLSNATVGTTVTGPPVVAGMIVRSGTTVANVYNNMISIGDGQTTNTCFIGIMLNHGSTPDPLDNIYFNTVVVSGTSAGGALISSCLNRGDLTATSRNQVVDIRNNIFINTRTGGTGNHYAISNNINATSSATGWVANASNYNVLNSAASTIGYWTAAQTFAGWQTASSSDANSISGPTVNLTNIPTADLHIVFPPSSVIEAAGILIPAITEDFDGQTRASLSPTDIGADAGNFVTAGINMGAESLVTPAVAANGCYTSAESVTIRIRNSDINPIDFTLNPVTVTTNVTGAATQTLSAVVNTGTLGAGLSLDVPMTGTLNMGTAGVYTFNAFTAVGGDTNPGNDAMPPADRTKAALEAGTASASPNQYCITGGTPTLTTAGATGAGGLQWQESTTPATGFTDIPGATTNPYTLASPVTQTMYYRLVVSCNGLTDTTNEVTVTLNNPQVTGTTPGASCGPGPVTVSLGATGTGTTLNWYDVPTGGVPVGTGSPFITPPISANTTYYVAASSGGGIANVGLPARFATATSGAGTTNFGLVFDVLSEFTLNSVVVYPIASAAGTAGTVTIDVIDAANVVLHTATVNVVGNPAATATAQTVTLNFTIAPGTNLKLRPGSRSAGITGLLFEPSAAAPAGNYGYPFTVPGVVTILHSTLTAAPTNTARLDLYYYFYNWEISTGCESARTAVLASVTTPPAATINYAGSPYCSNAGTATVTQTGTAGGTYSSTAGLSINPATGEITLGTSTPGTYTVTYSIAPSGGCPLYTTTASVTITAAPAATIAYAGSPYCSTGGTATVTLTGTTGGTYSSTAGLTINAATGDVTLGTSTPGTYTVTYTIAAGGGCALFTTTGSITINAGPNATISYAGSPYCTNGGTAAVTQTGTSGGTYSSTAGLTINAATGEVTLGTSTPGTYTVTYTIAAGGGCPVYTTTTTITVLNCSDPCSSITTIACTVPATVTLSGSGVWSPGSCGFSTPGTEKIYSFTPAFTGVYSLQVTSTSATGYIDYFIKAASGGCSAAGWGCILDIFSPTTASMGTLTAGVEYYILLDAETTSAVTHTFQVICPCPVITLGASPVFCSGTTTANLPYTIVTGSPDQYSIDYNAAAEAAGFVDVVNAALPASPVILTVPAAAAAAVYNATFTVRNSVGGCVSTPEAFTITINAAPAATISYTGSPYCNNAGTANVTQTGTAGGTYSSTAGLTINPATGAVTLGTSTPGTYTVTYTIAAGGGCPVYTTTASITITALPAATISYTGSPYCSTTATATVTRTGSAGGTYTAAPAGLTINPATGTVTPLTSTPGTYTVTYTIAAGGGCPAFSTTAPITITPAPNMSIMYTGSPYCSNAGTATVTQMGTAGGTYSAAPAGLTINATTGAVTLGTSTPGTYTVTYTIPAGGGCGITFTTTTITVTPAPAATISYTGSPYCSNAGTAAVTRTGTAGGTYSSTAGLTINSTTGAVTLGTSTPGTYTVTYTIAAGGGCAIFTTTTTITINALPAATISYAGSPYCSNAGTASVTRTGTAGGVYSAGAGLSINATTGAVTLGTSTPGTYTVTYTIAAAGGCPVVTATTSITITSLPAATISYAGSPYCSNAGTATVTRTGTAGGVYSSTAGLSINAATGDVTLGTSTPGTYTVTYTIAAGGGCPVVTATTTIIVSALSVAPTAANTSAATLCGPGNVTLSVAGGSLGAGASWRWYSGSCGGTAVGSGATLNVAVNATTTYFVRAEGTCNTTTCASVTVTVNTQPAISIAAAPGTVLKPFMTSTLTATVNPAAGNTIIWYRNGSAVPGASGLSLVVQADQLGQYTARATTATGCTALSNEISITAEVSNQLFITPNPNNGQFKVRFYTSANSLGFVRRLVMFAENGQKVFDQSYPITAPYSSMDIDARRLPKGIYIVMLMDAFGKEVLATGKVIIQ